MVKSNGKITNRDVCSYGSMFVVLIPKFFAYFSLILKFFFLWQFLKRLKNMQSKISLQIEIKVQVSPIHRYTAVDILLFLFSGWVLKSSSLKVLYSLADVVRGEPFNEHESYRNWSQYGFGAIFPYFSQIIGTLTDLYMSEVHLFYTIWGLLWHMWGYIRHHWFEIFLYRLFLCCLNNWLTLP